MLNKLVFLLVMVISIEAAMIAGTRLRAPHDDGATEAAGAHLTARTHFRCEGFGY